MLGNNNHLYGWVVKTSLVALLSYCLLLSLGVSAVGWSTPDGYEDRYVNVYDFLNPHHRHNRENLAPRDDYGTVSDAERVGMRTTWRADRYVPPRRAIRAGGRRTSGGRGGRPDRVSMGDLVAPRSSGSPNRGIGAGSTSRVGMTSGVGDFNRIPGTWGA